MDVSFEALDYMKHEQVTEILWSRKESTQEVPPTRHKSHIPQAPERCIKFIDFTHVLQLHDLHGQ